MRRLGSRAYRRMITEPPITPSPVPILDPRPPGPRILARTRNRATPRRDRIQTPRILPCRVGSRPIRSQTCLQIPLDPIMVINTAPHRAVSLKCPGPRCGDTTTGHARKVFSHGLRHLHRDTNPPTLRMVGTTHGLVRHPAVDQDIPPHLNLLGTRESNTIHITGAGRTDKCPGPVIRPYLQETTPTTVRVVMSRIQGPVYRLRATVESAIRFRQYSPSTAPVCFPLGKLSRQVPWAPDARKGDQTIEVNPQREAPRRDRSRS